MEMFSFSFFLFWIRQEDWKTLTKKERKSNKTGNSSENEVGGVILHRMRAMLPDKLAT